MEQTGNTFDLALDGEGFFALSDPESGETRYTRAGRFSLDDEGMLRAASGLQVEGQDGPVQIPLDARNVEIKSDGTVAVDGAAIGKISVVTFEDLSVLQRQSGAEFTAGEAEAIDAPAEVKQGYVESSNVAPIEAMTGMIKHLRIFEMQQRMLRSTDENLSQAVRSLGRF